MRRMLSVCAAACGFARKMRSAPAVRDIVHLAESYRAHGPGSGARHGAVMHRETSGPGSALAPEYAELEDLPRRARAAACEPAWNLVPSVRAISHCRSGDRQATAAFQGHPAQKSR